jgi:hypothetical protein
MLKNIYIAFIFVANMLLLVHTVIPHHHHQGRPHFVLYEMHENDNADDCCCKHGGGQTCLFEQDIDAVYEHSEDNCTCALHALQHHSDMFLQAILYPVFIYDFSLVRETVTFLEPPYFSEV